MDIMLDTHILLWALSGDPALPSKAKELIEDNENNIFFSVISLWETEMKHISHPTNLRVSGREVEEYCKGAGFSMLQLNTNCIYLLSTLCRPNSEPPHKDPFDKILICQSIAEKMIFLTHDKLLGGYGLKNIFIV